MKNDFIPFQLGMQYENWEFTLDILPERLKGYDSYLNIDESFTKFFGFKTDKTEVIFKFDVLDGVILTFENKSHTFYNDLKKSIFWEGLELNVLNMPYSLESDDPLIKIAKCISYQDNKVYLLYCNKSIFNRLFYTLI